MDQLAEKSGVSKSQISRIEGEDRNWSVESLKKLAEAFGVAPTDLLVLAHAWIDAPLLGIIVDGGYYAPAPDGNKQAMVQVPAAYGEVLVLRVDSDSMYPRYNRGEHVVIHHDPVDPKIALGNECLVFLTNGQGLLRVVNKGSRPRLFNLTSHNQPPLTDVGIATCRPVVRL